MVTPKYSATIALKAAMKENYMAWHPENQMSYAEFQSIYHRVLI